MSFERLKKLLSYAPQAVINRILRDLRPATVPTLRKVNGAVVYVHFAPHSAAFEQVAALYEAIAACVVDEYAGDIVHMSVAGIAILWDRERTSESLGTLALRALHVAYRIRTLSQMPRYAHASLPLASIGVARGPLALLFIGGVNGLWHYVLGGAPLVRASVAALSGAPGCIVLDDDDWLALEPYAHGIVAEPLGSQTREELVVLRGEPAANRSQPIKIGDRAGELDDRLQRRLEHLNDIEQLLFTYVAAPVGARLRNHEEQSVWLNDVRTVAAVTIRLSALRYDEAHCDEVHSAVCVIQSFANHFGGYLLSVYTRGNDTCASVVFGLPPVAVENLAPLATTMALELLQTFRRGDAYVDVNAGVATGRVVGGSVGSTSRHVHMLCGTAITESEQMAFESPPQTVTVDDCTWGGLSNFVRRPSLRPTWWVVTRRRNSLTKRKPVESELLDSINADAQASTLDALLDETALFVASGTARLVLVEGAIGTGKRRVMTSYLHALQETDFGAGDTPPLVLESRGDPTERNTPFYVWRGIFEQLLEAAACATVDELIDACPMLIDVRKDEPAPVLNVLSNVLPMTITTRDLFSNVSTASVNDEHAYRQAARIMLGLLLELVPDASKVIVLGSCACIDSHSWNLILSLHQSAPTVMLVLFARPLEARASSESQQRQLLASSDVLVLRMAPWSREHICQLVCAVTRAGALDDRVADLIVARACGNPFFATELALALVESGRVSVQPLASAPAPVQAYHSIFMSPNAASALRVTDSNSVPKGVVLAPVAPDSLTSGPMPFPSTMQGVIQRRVDSLSGVQQLVLRVAAVIGEVFEPQLLIDIMPLKVGVDVRRHVGELCDIEFFESAVVNAKAFRLPHKATARAMYVVLNDGKLASVVGDTVTVERVHGGGVRRLDSSSTTDNSEEEDRHGDGQHSRPTDSSVMTINTDDPEVAESTSSSSSSSSSSSTSSSSRIDDDDEDSHGPIRVRHRHQQKQQQQQQQQHISDSEYSERYEYESIVESSDDEVRMRQPHALQAPSASDIMKRLRTDTNHSGSSLRDDDEDDDDVDVAAHSDDLPRRHVWSYRKAADEPAVTVGNLVMAHVPIRYVKPRFRATLSDLRSAAALGLPVAAPTGVSPSAKTSPTVSDDEQEHKRKQRKKHKKKQQLHGSDELATAASANSTVRAGRRRRRVRVRRRRTTIGAGDGDDAWHSAESEPANSMAASGSIQQFGFDVTMTASSIKSSLPNWRSESPVSKSFDVGVVSSMSPADSASGVGQRSTGTGDRGGGGNGNGNGGSSAIWSIAADMRGAMGERTALRVSGMSTLLQFVDLSVQQSVYDMILPSQRRQLHVLVAEWYEDRYRGHLEPYWALLAHHWSCAERAMGAHDAQSGPLLKKTIFYLAKAAEHARQVSANRAATEYYQSLLRIARERPGSVDSLSVVEWASLCGRTQARLGETDRATEMCRIALETSGFDMPDSNALSKLYRRIVPARLRGTGSGGSGASNSGGSGSMSGSDTTSTRLQGLMASVYLTLSFTYSTHNDPALACECASLAITCAEKAGDSVIAADAQSMLCVMRSASGDVSGAVIARGRAISEMQALRGRQRVSQTGLAADSGFDGHSLKAQLSRVLLTCGHALATCGYVTTALNELSLINSFPELPEAAKALFSQSMCLWALGRLSEAAVFTERALLVSPAEDFVLRRWCYARAKILAVLGCPDVARAVLDQEQRLDPLLRDIEDERERVMADGTPQTPANILVGYERLLYMSSAAVVSLSQAHYDECVAYLRMASAHTQTACGSLVAAFALMGFADAAVQLALLVQRTPSLCTAVTPASAVALADFHVRRMRCSHVRLYRGWQRLFDGYLALLGGRVSGAIDAWTEGIEEACRELPALPPGQSSSVFEELLLSGYAPQASSEAFWSQKLDNDGSPTSMSEIDSDLDDDDDDDEDAAFDSDPGSGGQQRDVLQHEKFSAALRTTQSLKRASTRVFGTRYVARSHSGPLGTMTGGVGGDTTSSSMQDALVSTAPERLNGLRSQSSVIKTVEKESTSDSSQEAISEGRATLNNSSSAKRFTLSTSGGIKRDMVIEAPAVTEKQREGRQPYLLARIYDAIGLYLAPRKASQERVVLRKRLHYLQQAHKLYLQVGATVEMRTCQQNIEKLAHHEQPTSTWAAFRGHRNDT